MPVMPLLLLLPTSSSYAYETSSVHFLIMSAWLNKRLHNCCNKEYPLARIAPTCWFWTGRDRTTLLFPINVLVINILFSLESNSHNTIFLKRVSVCMVWKLIFFIFFDGTSLNSRTFRFIFITSSPLSPYPYPYPCGLIPGCCPYP